MQGPLAGISEKHKATSTSTVRAFPHMSPILAITRIESTSGDIAEKGLVNSGVSPNSLNYYQALLKPAQPPTTALTSMCG